MEKWREGRKKEEREGGRDGQRWRSIRRVRRKDGKRTPSVDVHHNATTYTTTEKLFLRIS